MCNEALGTLSSLAVERKARSRFLVGLVDVPQSCQQNLLCFCRVRSALAH